MTTAYFLRNFMVHKNSLKKTYLQNLKKKILKTNWTTLYLCILLIPAILQEGLINN